MGGSRDGLEVWQGTLIRAQSARLKFEGRLSDHGHEHSELHNNIPIDSILKDGLILITKKII
jgi:hypothetical protein